MAGSDVDFAPTPEVLDRIVARSATLRRRRIVGQAIAGVVVAAAAALVIIRVHHEPQRVVAAIPVTTSTSSDATARSYVEMSIPVGSFTVHLGLAGFTPGRLTVEPRTNSLPEGQAINQTFLGPSDSEQYNVTVVLQQEAAVTAAIRQQMLSVDHGYEVRRNTRTYVVAPASAGTSGFATVFYANGASFQLNGRGISIDELLDIADSIT